MSHEDFLFGQEGEPAQVLDVRPQEQIDIQQRILNDLETFVGEGGFPAFPGPTTVGTTSFEDQLLAQLQNVFTDGGGATDAGRTTLAGLTTPEEALNPLFFNIDPTDFQASFGQFGDILSGASADPNDPRVQAAINAAIRPILEQFEDEFAQTRGTFTQAGQFVQPGSSSPFELASSRLSTGLANALGDTSANIVFQNLNAERGRQLELIGLLSDAFETGQNRRLDASTAIPGFERSEIENIISGLDAAALPRLIEQFGVTQGQRIFEQQQEQLLAVLQLLVSGNQPQIVTIPGTEGGGGILEPVLSGAAGIFGQAGGDFLGDLIFGGGSDSGVGAVTGGGTSGGGGGGGPTFPPGVDLNDVLVGIFGPGGSASPGFGGNNTTELSIEQILEMILDGIGG